MKATESLLAALAEITGTGKFHSSGSCPFFFPELMVDGLGEIAFPLSTGQAKELTSMAEAAPFGKGSRTVFDESVRKCWQIDAGGFSLASAQWAKFLKRTIESIRKDLGIQGQVSASPYKLLIYGKGGHFKAHKDTEKLDAMFGTLVIALPSKHTGGKLHIRHDRKEVTVDFSADAHRHDIQYAAFFADCEHEVEPVLSGYRCCLVYNLRLAKGDPAILNQSISTQAAKLLPSMKSLRNERAGCLSAILLEHGYTEANLSLRNLKGNDQARAQALLAAATATGFTAHLALVTFHQMGELEEADYHYRGRRRYRDYDDEEDENGHNDSSATMGEVYDEDLGISSWRDARDRRVQLGEFRIDPGTLISRRKINDGEPDEKEAEGFTGNAGCTVDYWYRRAAIVLWAEEDSETIQCTYDFRGACDSLEQLAGSLSKQSARDAFQRLASAVIACYPKALPPIVDRPASADFSNDPLLRVFAALAKSGDRGLLDRLLKQLPATAFLVCNSKYWKLLFDAFGPEPFEPACNALLKHREESQRRQLFHLLATFNARKSAVARVKVIAARLATFAPKPPRVTHGEPRRDPVPPGDREEALILLAAARHVDNPKDLQAIRAFLWADGSLAYIRDVLGPVLLEKSLAKDHKAPRSLAVDLLASATDTLAAEIARPLVPYPDWTRPFPGKQGSAKESDTIRPYRHRPDPLAELATFMADPKSASHQFARPEADRAALEHFIKTNMLDLDCNTIRQGSPHKLACTKNDRSYQHAVATRRKDKTLLANLRALVGANQGD